MSQSFPLDGLVYAGSFGPGDLEELQLELDTLNPKYADVAMHILRSRIFENYRSREEHKNTDFVLVREDGFVPQTSRGQVPVPREFILRDPPPPIPPSQADKVDPSAHHLYMSRDETFSSRFTDILCYENRLYSVDAEVDRVEIVSSAVPVSDFLTEKQLVGISNGTYTPPLTKEIRIYDPFYRADTWDQRFVDAVDPQDDDDDDDDGDDDDLDGNDDIEEEEGEDEGVGRRKGRPRRRRRGRGKPIRDHFASIHVSRMNRLAQGAEGRTLADPGAAFDIEQLPTLGSFEMTRLSDLPQRVMKYVPLHWLYRDQLNVTHLEEHRKSRGGRQASRERRLPMSFLRHDRPRRSDESGGSGVCRGRPLRRPPQNVLLMKMSDRDAMFLSFEAYPRNYEFGAQVLVGARNAVSGLDDEVYVAQQRMRQLDTSGDLKFVRDWERKRQQFGNDFVTFRGDPDENYDEDGDDGFGLLRKDPVPAWSDAEDKAPPLPKHVASRGCRQQNYLWCRCDKQRYLDGRADLESGTIRQFVTEPFVRSWWKEDDNRVTENLKKVPGITIRLATLNLAKGNCLVAYRSRQGERPRWLVDVKWDDTPNDVACLQGADRVILCSKMFRPKFSRCGLFKEGFRANLYMSHIVVQVSVSGPSIRAMPRYRLAVTASFSVVFDICDSEAKKVQIDSSGIAEIYFQKRESLSVFDGTPWKLPRLKDQFVVIKHDSPDRMKSIGVVGLREMDVIYFRTHDQVRENPEGFKYSPKREFLDPSMLSLDRQTLHRTRGFHPQRDQEPDQVHVNPTRGSELSIGQGMQMGQIIHRDPVPSRWNTRLTTEVVIYPVNEELYDFLLGGGK